MKMVNAVVKFKFKESFTNRIESLVVGRVKISFKNRSEGIAHFQNTSEASEAELMEAIEKVARYVGNELIIKELVNTVFEAYLGESFGLEALAYCLKGKGVRFKYEPEKFPGLQLWIDKFCFNLFSNGKVIIFKALSKNEAEEALKKLKKVVKEALKKPEYKSSPQAQVYFYKL